MVPHIGNYVIKDSRPLHRDSNYHDSSNSYSIDNNENTDSSDEKDSVDNDSSLNEKDDNQHQHQHRPYKSKNLQETINDKINNKPYLKQNNIDTDNTVDIQQGEIIHSYVRDDDNSSHRNSPKSPS